MISSWTTISGHLQGDISYSLRKVLVTPSYIDFEITTFGQAWQECDFAFEYRLSNKEEWKDDAVITQTTAKFLRCNNLYGLPLSKDGVVNTLQWKYSENNLFYGNTPQIRLRALPRVRIFSGSGSYHQVSSAYGDSLVNFDGQSRHDCIGINKSGQYMCVGSDTFYIIDSIDDEEFSTSSSSSTEVMSSSSTEIMSSESSSSSSSYLYELYVNGSISPDVSGTYLESGTYNGKPTYTDGTNIIYWDFGYYGWTWGIGAGGIGLFAFESPSNTITGTYYPIGGAEGNPIVARNP